MSNLNKNFIPSFFDVASEVGETIFCHPLTIVKEYIRQKPEGENILYFKELITDKLASYVDKLYFNDEINGYHIHTPSYYQKYVYLNLDLLNSYLAIYEGYKGYRNYVESFYEDIPEQYKLIADIYILNTQFQIQGKKISAINTNTEKIKKYIQYIINTLKQFDDYPNNGIKIFYLFFARQIIDNSNYLDMSKDSYDTVKNVCKDIASEYSYIDYEKLASTCFNYLQFKAVGTGISSLLEHQLPKVKIIEDKTEGINVWLCLILYTTRLKVSNSIKQEDSCEIKEYKIMVMNESSEIDLRFTNPYIQIEDNSGKKAFLDVRSLLLLGEFK